MVPKISAQLFSKSLLTGTFALISIGNAIASEIPTVQVSAVDRQSELLTDSTDDSIAKIGGIYPINTLLNPESTPATSDLALARRKKRTNTKPQIKRGGSYSQPQIQNNQINTPPQIQNNQINTPPQIQNNQINTPPQVQNNQINTPPPMPSGFSATQKQIQYKRNDLSVAAQFGNGTSFGVQGKLGLTDNISIRPEFFFGNGGGDVENKEPILNPITISSGTPFSLDSRFKLVDEVSTYTTEFPLIVNKTFFSAKEIKISETFVTNRPIETLTAIEGIVVIPAGTIIPAGSIIPAISTIPVDSYLPKGTTIISPSDSKVDTNVVATSEFRFDTATLLTAAYTTSIPFITNVPIGNFPAGAVIPASTTFAAGTVLPAGTFIPVDTRTSNTIPSAIPVGSIKGKTTTSTSYGLAVTYDFKLDPIGKSTAYLGPKIAFTSASASVDIPNSAPLTLNTNETKIGLVAGVDYVIFDGFTLGANANYYFSRSLNGSGSSNGVSFPLQSVSGGSATDFGLRIGYQF